MMNRFRNYLKKKAMAKEEHNKGSHPSSTGCSSGGSSPRDHLDSDSSDYQPLMYNGPQDPRAMIRPIYQQLSFPRAHIFGSRGNEASCLPLLAIMNKAVTSQSQSHGPDIKYLNSLRAQVSLVESQQQPPRQHMDRCDNPRIRKSPVDWQDRHSPPTKVAKYEPYLVTPAPVQLGLAMARSIEQTPTLSPRHWTPSASGSGTSSPTSETNEDKMEMINQRYLLALAQTFTPPKFIENLQEFHSDFKTDQLSSMDFTAHLFRLATLFKTFAESQPSFKKLDLLDQRHLLERNTTLFVMYMFGRYLGSRTGEEQLQWLLDENMPTNLSGAKPNLVGFTEFNHRLRFFNDNASTGQYSNFEECIRDMAATKLDYHCTGLVANLLLFNTDANTESTAISANFIEALELVKLSHQQVDIAISFEPVLRMVKQLRWMQDMFDQRISFASEVRLPFLGVRLPYTPEEEVWVSKELRWLQEPWEQVNQSKDLITSLVNYCLGADTAKELCPRIIQSFLERMRAVVVEQPEFKAVPVSVQNRLWSQNCLACLALCLARLLAAPGACQQLQLLSADAALDTIVATGVDLMRLKPLTLAGLSQKLSPAETAEFQEMVTSLGELLADEDNFRLMISAQLLFNGDDDALVQQGHHAYVQLLQRRLEFKLNASFPVEEMLKRVDRASFLITKLNE